MQGGQGEGFCLRQAQAGRMAVRNTPIVWAEGSPLVRPQAQAPATGIRRLPEGGAGGNEGKRVPSGHNRRRWLATGRSGKQQAERTAVRAASIVCPEESPFAGAYPCPVWIRRLPEGGAGGERREAGIQWIQPPKAVSDPEFRQTTSGAHGSAGRADCLPRGKPPACCRKKFPFDGD